MTAILIGGTVVPMRIDVGYAVGSHDALLWANRFYSAGALLLYVGAARLAAAAARRPRP